MKLGNEVAPFRLVRLLRAVRLLRTVRLFPNLALVVETTVKSASSVVYIGMFMLLFTYMFAIVGVASFGRNDPFYFGNLARALLTLFRTVSMDSWSMIMYYNIWGCGQPNFDGNGTSRGYGDYYVETGMKCEHNPHGSFAAAYFVSFMFFTAFLILNLFIGIITTEMQAAKKEAERLRKTQNKLALATRLRMRQSDETNDEPTPDGQTRLERNPTFDDETSGN
jgi:voltage-gated sodium channel